MTSRSKRFSSFAYDTRRRNGKSLTFKKNRINEDDPTYVRGAKRILGFIHDAWFNNVLCDTVIKVKSGEIHTHKLLLCAYSQAIMYECQNFPHGNIVSLDLSDYPVEIVWELLNFIYTANLEIHQDNLTDLLKLAAELDIKEVVHLCEDFMEKFDSTNALKFYEIAIELNLEVATRLQSYICRNFIDIVNSKHFLRLTPSKLTSIISDERLCIMSELDIFLAIVRWINHESKTRLQLAPKLLAHVNFEKIAPEILATHVERFTEIFENCECHRMLYSAMKYVF